MARLRVPKQIQPALLRLAESLELTSSPSSKAFASKELCSRAVS